MPTVSPEHVRSLYDHALRLHTAATRLEPLRRSTLMLRNELHHEQEGARYKRRYYQQSRQQFADYASAIACDTSAPEMQRHYKLLSEDYITLDELEHQVQALEATISRKEFSMQSEENILAAATVQLVGALQDAGLMSSAHVVDKTAVESLPIAKQPSLSSHSSSPDVDPHLADYYDKLGDANLMHERLIDLDADHRDAHAARQLRQDQELPVQGTDEEFHQLFQSARDYAARAYESAYEIACAARQACLNNGIDPDGHDTSVHDQGTDQLSNINPRMPNHLQSEALPVGESAMPTRHTVAGIGSGYLGYRVNSSTMLPAAPGKIDDDISQPAIHHQAEDVELVHQRIANRDQNSSSKPNEEANTSSPIVAIARVQTAHPSQNIRFSQNYQRTDQQRQPTQNNLTQSVQSISREQARQQFQPSRYDKGNLTVIETYNPKNQVRTIIAPGQFNPESNITDPALLQVGVKARGMLIGSGKENEPEKLYSKFKVRPHGFFVLGRVFLVLWVEPAGTTVVTNLEENDNFLPGRYQDEFVYSKVRRFVVIREGRDYCSALPIVSYGHQGVGRKGVNKAEHAIIYTGPNEPNSLPTEKAARGEAGMRRTAIRVTPDNPTDKLDPVSRIDLGKVHTIQHNIKVKALGMVCKESMPALLSQFRNAWHGDTLVA